MTGKCRGHAVSMVTAGGSYGNLVHVQNIRTDEGRLQKSQPKNSFLIRDL